MGRAFRIDFHRSMKDGVIRVFRMSDKFSSLLKKQSPANECTCIAKQKRDSIKEKS